MELVEDVGEGDVLEGGRREGAGNEDSSSVHVHERRTKQSEVGKKKT